MRSHGIFSLGGCLALVWRPAYPLLPWALTSALLMSASVWDHWTRGARIEWLVAALAAYELMIGLLEPIVLGQRSPGSVPASREIAPRANMDQRFPR